MKDKIFYKYKTAVIDLFFHGFKRKVLLLTRLNDVQINLFLWYPVDTRRYFDVDSTFFERYRRQMDVKTTLVITARGVLYSSKRPLKKYNFRLFTRPNSLTGRDLVKKTDV